MINHIIKWTFVKNLSVRTTAQIVVLKLIEKFNVIDCYKLIYDNITKEHETQPQAMENIRTKKWCPMNDFRLNHIDCSQLLNSVYVLREIPRLTQMQNDEIYYGMLRDYDEHLIIDIQPINARDHNARLDMETEIGVCSGKDGISGGGSDGIKNTQKKIVPLKQTFVDGELLNGLPFEMQLSLEVRAFEVMFDFF